MKVRLPSNSKSQNDFSTLAQQAKNMQAKFEEALGNLETKTYESLSGGGAVKCVITGKMQIQKLEINKNVIDPEDPSMLEDLIITAVNDGLNQATSEREQITSEISGANLPSGLF